MPRLARWAAAPALALLAVSLIVALSGSHWGYAGTNAVRPTAGVVTLAPGRSACQAGEILPRGAAYAEFAITVASGTVPALRVRVTDRAGAPVASGTLAAGAAPGLVAVPISRLRASRLDGRVCLVDAGAAPVVLGGTATATPGIVVGGKPQPALVRIGWREPRGGTWFGEIPEIAHRFGIAKASWVAAWTFWLVVGLMLVAGTLAVRIVLAGDDDEAAGPGAPAAGA